MIAGVSAVLRERWRELAGVSLLFRLAEGLLFAPAAALVGQWLLGRTVLDSTALVSFLLSPRGFLALVFAAVTAVTLRLIEHAGLSVIVFGALENRRVPAGQALRMVGCRFVTLMHVAFRFVGLGLLVVLPLVVVAGGCAAWLLPRHDVNYFLKLRPPEFVTAAVLLGVVAAITVAVGLLLVVRWRWVVQIVLFEGRGVTAAFSESAQLTRGRRGALLRALVAVTLVSLTLGLLASMLGNLGTSLVLRLLGGGATSLAILFGVLLGVRMFVSAGGTWFGACLDAGVFTSLYRRRLAGGGGEVALPGTDAAEHVTGARWLAVLVAAGLVVISVSGARLAFQALGADDGVTIHAHRGVSTRAAENTLGAVREAMVAGADYVETDVQLTKDDVLVITHDSDFSRLGGVARKVWDLTYDEIRAIPLGVSPEGRGECAPTLDALLAEVQGRAKVNLELKYYGGRQPDLARKVVEAVRARGMLGQVVIQCLEYEPLQEVRRLAPEVPVGYLLSFNAREPSRLDVDFLSVEQKRINRGFVEKAHRQGKLVYAWTVNRSTDMERVLDLGVDGLITDQTALARTTLQAYRERSGTERAKARVRAWLADE